MINVSKIGFTTIELAVSIFIIALLLGAFAANYHSANKRSELIAAAQKMASDIRLAQQFSLGSKEFNGAVPAGGWGVFFDTTTPNSYLIFADIDSPDGNQGYDAGEEWQRVSLPAGVNLSGLSDNSGALSATTVVFLPPDPATYINGALDNKTTITLKENSGNSTKAVEVNFLGLVEVAE